MLVKHGLCPSRILLWLCSSNSCEHSFILDSFVPRSKITVASSSLKATWVLGILCYLGFMVLCRFLCPILMRSYRHLSSIELTFLSSASIDGLWTLSKHCAPSSLICSSTFCYPSSTSIDLRSVWELVCLGKHPRRHIASFPSSLCIEIQALTNLASHPIPMDPPLSSSLLWLLIYPLLHTFLWSQIAHAHRILLLLTTFFYLHCSMPVKLLHVIYFRKKKVSKTFPFTPWEIQSSMPQSPC